MSGSEGDAEMSVPNTVAAG